MTNQPVTWKSGRSDAPPPPLIQLRPLGGESFAKLGQISAFFLENYRQAGPIYRFRRVNEQFTVIAGPEANQFMARDGREHFHAEEYRREQNDEFGIAKTLVSLAGEEHYYLRKLQKPGYARSALNPHFPRLVAIVRDAARQWPPGQSLAAADIMAPLIAEQLGWGVLNHPTGDYWPDIVLWVRSIVLTTLSRLQPKSILERPEYLQAKARVMRLADEIIAARRAQGPDGREPDLVDDLLAAVAEDPNLMTPQELRIAVLGPYIGGLDSTAHTCIFMLYALLNQPETLARVTAEVDAAFEGGQLRPAALKNLECLHYAAMETLRLYPVAAAIQGTVTQPFEFAGYRVDEGENLIVAAAVPHHLAEYFPEPYQFDIDRFGEGRREHLQPGVYAPFGLGTHICLGAGIAETLIMLTMATLLHTVDLEMEPPDYKLRIELKPSPRPDDRFRVRVVAQRPEE